MTDYLPLDDRIRIPTIGFGTYLIRDEDAAVAVQQAIAMGYRHIDTAEMYRNEDGVGQGIRAASNGAGIGRDDLFVTTKLWPGGAGLGEAPKSAAAVTAALDTSLRKLGLDHVDLYLIHSPHAGAARLEQWGALLALKQSGKARAVGVSNYSIAHLEEIEAAGLATPEANQIELHLWSQKAELVAHMRDVGILPIAYSSLAPLATWRVGQGSAKTGDMTRQGAGAIVADLAKAYAVSEAQLLLRWAIQKEFAILPKSVDPERMRQNFDLNGFSISETDMAALDSMERGDGLAWPGGDPTRLS